MIIRRRRFKQTTTFDDRLEKQAAKLRKEAQGTPPGVARDGSPAPRKAGRYGRTRSGMAEVSGPAGADCA